jgi:hypothetical protein
MGAITENWLILKNGDQVIGLFHGMFDKNTMTFNPGWDSNASELKEFMDVREIQDKLQADGVELASEVETGSQGPGSFLVIDPDGNPILFDQHV